MERDDTAKERKAIPAPGVLILTGASHAGKSTLADAFLERLPPPAAVLSVDDVLEHQLRRPGSDKWSNIPLAYEILTGELELLLRAGWFVVFESTFTYVPPSGPPQLHLEALERVLDVADRNDAPAFVARVRAPLQALLARAATIDRLDPAVVTATFALHEADPMASLNAYQIDTGELSPAQAAASILARIEAVPNRPGN